MDYAFTIPVETAAAIVATDTSNLYTPIDFLLGDDGDLDLTTGDLRWSSGLTGVVQACEAALRLQFGEWYLDTSAGIDYFGKVLVKNPNLLVINRIVRETLLSVPFVTEVTSVGVSFTSATRSASISWRAKCAFGAIAQTTEVVV